MKKIFIVVSFLYLGFIGSAAAAGAILSADSAVINSGGPGHGSINDTINQNGLSTAYTSGVTDFDAYIASGVTHTTTFPGFEWFSNSGTTTASVTFNLGALASINSIALWNEESSGIGSLDVYTSTDGISFSLLDSGLLATDNSTAMHYQADVFSFAAISTQYVRFDMSECPQVISTSFDGCSIGEVAFREADEIGVPEASSIMLLGLGLAGLGFSRRKKTA